MEQTRRETWNCKLLGFSQFGNSKITYTSHEINYKFQKQALQQITLGIKASKRISSCGTGTVDFDVDSGTVVEGVQDVMVFSKPRINVCSHKMVNPSKLI